MTLSGSSAVMMIILVYGVLRDSLESKMHTGHTISNYDKIDRFDLLWCGGVSKIMLGLHQL